MPDAKTVEVESHGDTRTVVGTDGGPWWARFAMQAGFMFILLLVLWGIYDFLKVKMPTLAEPLQAIAETVEKGQAIDERRTKATEGLADAAKAQAEAAKTQAEAIKRWVDIQSYQSPRLTHTGYGPPRPQPEP